MFTYTSCIHYTFFAHLDELFIEFLVFFSQIAIFLVERSCDRKSVYRQRRMNENLDDSGLNQRAVSQESERSALLVSLCKRTFRTGVIIFFRSKKLAHQMRIVFSLLELKADELHGDLSQEQVWDNSCMAHVLYLMEHAATERPSKIS